REARRRGQKSRRWSAAGRVRLTGRTPRPQSAENVLVRLAVLHPPRFGEGKGKTGLPGAAIKQYGRWRLPCWERGLFDN
ncbi:MAG TPA: hypothetical protein VFP60_01490, partial [Pseudolabrys sp.]|nr:hypothetical protein [Pseudolabrys sp.]